MKRNFDRSNPLIDLTLAHHNQLMIQMDNEASQSQSLISKIKAEAEQAKDKIRLQEARVVQMESDLGQLLREKENLEINFESQVRSFEEERSTMQQSLSELQNLMDSSHDDDQEIRFSSLEKLEGEHERGMGQLHALHKQGMTKLLNQIEEERSGWKEKEGGLLERAEAAEAGCRKFESLLTSHEAELLNMRGAWVDDVAALEASLASLSLLHRESEADLIRAREEAVKKDQGHSEMVVQLEERLAALADEYDSSQAALLEAQRTSKVWEEKAMQGEEALLLLKEQFEDTRETLAQKENEVRIEFVMKSKLVMM